MRRLIVLLGILVISLNLSAQRKGAYMSFETTVHDFGKIKQENGPVSYKFVFVNTGDQPVIIQNVQTSCGCTTPSWTRQPVVPGAKGYVEVQYDPRNRPGSFHKTILVYSNAKNSPVKLEIKGYVLEKENTVVEQFPFDFGKGLRLTNRVVNFGVLYTDQKRTKTIKVYNNSSATIRLEPAGHRIPQYLSVSVKPSQIPPKSQALITITYDASKVNDWDFVRGRIFFMINGELYLNRWIDVTAIIKEAVSPEVKANPPIIKFETTRYDFGKIKAGEVVTYDFKFKNVGKSDLIIRKVKTSCGCTTPYYTKEPVPPGGEGKITVKFNSQGRQGRQIKIITVITNSPDPSSYKVTLRLEGYVEPH